MLTKEAYSILELMLDCNIYNVEDRYTDLERKALGEDIALRLDNLRNKSPHYRRKLSLPFSAETARDISRTLGKLFRPGLLKRIFLNYSFFYRGKK
jgi:hypothetical protein